MRAKPIKAVTIKDGDVLDSELRIDAHPLVVRLKCGDQVISLRWEQTVSLWKQLRVAIQDEHKRDAKLHPSVRKWPSEANSDALTKRHEAS
jgi:hypothetical protein